MSCGATRNISGCCVGLRSGNKSEILRLAQNDKRNMSNVREERHVEADWLQEPVPPNVEFGEGFYCESAQIFRKLRSKEPRAIVIGKHVSCYAGCSFAIGENGRCKIGDFTLLNGALIMAEQMIEIGSHCLVSWNVGIAD